ncbi:hypothetical protein ACM9VS_05100 [Legionella pneumophila]|uniref:hypothetical protein n=1 Tax=Legionella pneumophila TaxID=446 RepID=UPI003A4C65D6
MNPNDTIRSQILEWFYDRHLKASSKYGKKGFAIKISEIKKDLKAKFGFTQQQVISNLHYLIDKGWINESEIEKTVQVAGGTIPSKVTWYEISSDGIDKIEAPSEFKDNSRYSGININATGNNVITMGDGNIVNIKYEQLHNELTYLKTLLATSNLPENEKLNISIDIESLKDQLAKENPDLASKFRTPTLCG